MLSTLMTPISYGASRMDTSSTLLISLPLPFAIRLSGTEGSHIHQPLCDSPGTYRLVQSAEQEDPKDIADNVPPSHEDLASQPPPIHCPVHVAASLFDISERLTQFEQ
ncbi:hypothetical protein PVK06_011829 [Gossypium arboreum]|uniref:Uncharacterized protein n=1 Tax=Gossypium arboreum TaxID=29729 RepID=A0ABR0Q9R2_GOSAR|nr:hypothetical protein PVK06_011829 [Gossypium arboreum]